jgi:hypothetical protein
MPQQHVNAPLTPMRSASVSGSAALLAPFQGFQRVEMPSHTFRTPRQLPGLPRGLAVRDGGVFLSSSWAASRRHGRRGRRQRRIRRVPVAAAVDAARDVAEASLQVADDPRRVS